jgi:hypothetical protein
VCGRIGERRVSAHAQHGGRTVADVEPLLRQAMTLRDAIATTREVQLCYRVHPDVAHKLQQAGRGTRWPAPSAPGYDAAPAYDPRRNRLFDVPMVIDDRMSPYRVTLELCTVDPMLRPGE